jgi:predicted nucleic acid-binding Zn ribbon protein
MTQKRPFRHPTQLTSHHLSDLLPEVLREIGASVEQQSELILAAWPQVVGPKLAEMAHAVAFRSGVLYVSVSHSTLFSLLQQRERPRLLQSLREKFPRTQIHNIVFRIGQCH